MQAVQEHIDPGSKGIGEGEAPVGAYCYVSAATALELDLSLTVTMMGGSEEAQVTEAIKAAVAAYLQEIAFAQDYVSYAQIAAAILDAPGVQDFENLTVNGGTGNVPVAAREVAVLGETAVSYGT